MKFRFTRAAMLGALLSSAVLAACGEDNPTAPADEQTLGAKSQADSGSGGQGTPTTPTPPRDTSHTPTPGTRPPIVEKFNLTMQALGMRSTDTTNVEPVPGTEFRLLLLITASGDTLATAQEVARATADAKGEVRFPNVASAAYRIVITPPAASGYAATELWMGSQTQAEVRFGVYLKRKE